MSPKQKTTVSESSDAQDVLAQTKALGRGVLSLRTSVAFPAGVDFPPLQSTIAIVVSTFRELLQRIISAEKKHGDSWSAKSGHVL